VTCGSPSVHISLLHDCFRFPRHQDLDSSLLFGSGPDVRVPPVDKKVHIDCVAAAEGTDARAYQREVIRPNRTLTCAWHLVYRAVRTAIGVFHPGP